MMNITIVLVDDHKIIRDGLRMLLSQQPGYQVVGEADNGRTAIQLIHTHQPDIVIMDIGMPELNGIEATRQILDRHQACKVIALSMHSDRRFILEMFQAGASGYLLKYSAFEELVRAILTVTDNKRYVSPEIADVVISECLHHAQESASSSNTILTVREREVLQLLAEGCTSKEIASRLSISVNTAETYRRQIMEKLDLHSIAELTRYAIREGLTPLDR